MTGVIPVHREEVKMNMIFISYSHVDSKWKDALLKQLDSLGGNFCYYFWDDGKIELGSEWEKEIEKVLGKAYAAVLLVSPDFLTSGFIKNKELPLILKRHQSDGLPVIPLLVRPSTFEINDRLNRFEAFPKDMKPLSLLSSAQAEDQLVKFAIMLNDLMQRRKRGDMSAKKTKSKPAPPAINNKKTVKSTPPPGIKKKRNTDKESHDSGYYEKDRSDDFEPDITWW